VLGSTMTPSFVLTTSNTVTLAPTVSAVRRTRSSSSACGRLVPTALRSLGEYCADRSVRSASFASTSRFSSPGRTTTATRLTAAAARTKKPSVSRARSERTAFPYTSEVSRKRCPTPRTVNRYSGSFASVSSFSRRWRMWTSIVRGSR